MFSKRSHFNTAFSDASLLKFILVELFPLKILLKPRCFLERDDFEKVFDKNVLQLE